MLDVYLDIGTIVFFIYFVWKYNNLFWHGENSYIIVLGKSLIPAAIIGALWPFLLAALILFCALFVIICVLLQTSESGKGFEMEEIKGVI